jgi:hypothetical protein
MSDAPAQDLGIYGGNQDIGYQEAVRRQAAVIQVQKAQAALSIALHLLTTNEFTDIAAYHPIIAQHNWD